MKTQEHKHKIKVFQKHKPQWEEEDPMLTCTRHGMACCLHAFHEDGDGMAGYEFNIT